jgi:hypothetical protein
MSTPASGRCSRYGVDEFVNKKLVRVIRKVRNEKGPASQAPREG